MSVGWPFVSVEWDGVTLPAVCCQGWGYHSLDVTNPNGAAPPFFWSWWALEEECVDVGPVGDEDGDWWCGGLVHHSGDVVWLVKE